MAEEAEDVVDDNVDDTVTDPTEEGEETEAQGESETDAEVEETEESDEEQPTRGETRQQKLANQLREEREARIRAEAERDTERKYRTTPQPANNSARERDERLALMTPEEKREFLRDEKMAALEQAVLATGRQSVDAGDRAAYIAKAAVNPIYKKYEARVEEQLQAFRQSGAYPARDAVLAYLVGQDALKSPKKASKKEKEAAATRVAVSKTTPLSGRGDAGGKKAKDDGSLESLKARILERESRGEANTY